MLLTTDSEQDETQKRMLLTPDGGHEAGPGIIGVGLEPDSDVRVLKHLPRESDDTSVSEAET